MRHVSKKRTVEKSEEITASHLIAPFEETQPGKLIIVQSITSSRACVDPGYNSGLGMGAFYPFIGSWSLFIHPYTCYYIKWIYKPSSIIGFFVEEGGI